MFMIKNKKIYFRKQPLSVHAPSFANHHLEKRGSSGRFFRPAGDNVKEGKVREDKVRGSVTIEGAVIISICLVVFAAALSFFNLLGGQIKKYNAAVELSQKTAVYAHILGDDSSSDITLPYEYSDKVMLLPESITNYMFYGEIVRRTWTGRSLNNIGSDEANEYVYVAENGSVYHTTTSCTHLKLAISEVSYSGISDLRNESGEKYSKCELCGDEASSETVYICAEGNRYHNNRECSGLKRSYKKVKKSECSLPACSRCGE